MIVKLPRNGLASVLNEHADRHPDKAAFRYFSNLADDPVDLSYGHLNRQAMAVAAALKKAAKPADRAILIYPAGLDFIVAFMGCLFSGVIAIPVCAPRAGQSKINFKSIVRDCTPTVILTTRALRAQLEESFAAEDDLPQMTWVCSDEVDADSAADWDPETVERSDIAFLQYTSGSTTKPRGVMVTHSNIVANAAHIQSCFRIDGDTIGLSWLPHYHDMGLMGKILAPIYSGCQVILTCPSTFVKRPLRWLEAITKFGATVSGGPDYAYDLCASIAKNKQLDNLDLSTWRVAINGSEPVRAATLQKFSETFAPWGFDPKAFSPCYGLAESTLLVTGIRENAEPHIESFDAGSLAHARVSAPEKGRPVKRLVSCGDQKSDLEVLVVSPKDLSTCGENEIGEICAAGPSVAKGYWNKDDENERIFSVRLDDCETRFLRTGDLGFVKDNRLYITGRKKDLIIIGGRNYYPQDIEILAVNESNGVRTYASAAFQCEHKGREKLILITEIRSNHDSDARRDLMSSIRLEVFSQLDIFIDGIILVKKGSLPKTSSGKMKRYLCSQHFQDGKLDIVEQSLVEESSNGSSNGVLGESRLRETSAMGLEEKAELLSRVANILGVQEDALSRDKSLYSQGLSSLRAAELALEIEQSMGVKLDQGQPLGEMTLDRLIATVAENADRESGWRMENPLNGVSKDHKFGENGGTGNGSANGRHGSNGEIDLDSRFNSMFLKNGNFIEKAHHFDLPDQLRDADRMPFFQALDRNEGAICVYQGKKAIMLGSNNYLGLTTDRRVRKAASQAALNDGPSLTGSRLLNGTTTKHTDLERKIADFLGYEDALIFTTGYQANLGLISAIMNEHSYVILDDECHASLYDGAILGRATIKEFRHNDIDDLDRKLAQLPRESDRIVIVDGVYSMQGDIALLPEIDGVCKRWNTPYMLDEAHALGVLGEFGRGTQEHYNFKYKADLLTGTFSKSLASIGGWVAGDAKVIDWVRFHGRPMLFSASLPPPSLAAAAAALEILKSEPWRIRRLSGNARYFRSRLVEIGFDVRNSETPIIPVYIGDDMKCIEFAKTLLDRGVFVNASVYPAVPKDSALIRTSVITTHEKGQLDRALEILEHTGREMGLIAGKPVR